jgi:hypothetical protein
MTVFSKPLTVVSLGMSGMRRPAAILRIGYLVFGKAVGYPMSMMPTAIEWM